MKLLIILCVLTIVGFNAANPANERGCRYILGRCVEECPEGTHSYTVCGPLTPEATCGNPEPKQQEGIVCDYSACHCDPPTVRDTASNSCIPLDQCPKE